MELKKQIRSYIEKDIGSKGYPFSDRESLYDLGILDSLKMIQFVLFLESEFHIQVDPSDMDVEDFESIDSIAAFIMRSHKEGEADA